MESLILAFILGLLFGILIGIIIIKLMAQKPATLNEFSKKFEQEYESLKVALNEEKNKCIELIKKNSELEAEKRTLIDKANNEQSLEDKFMKEFGIIASKILKENTTEFTQTNKNEVNQILEPFRTKVQELEKKIEETYVKDAKERASLEAQLKILVDQSQKVSEEANNLASALKSQVKTHGTWGEMILDKVLEASGLQENQHYGKQQRLETEEGKQLQPDVIIYLPENKHIIIDSKVTLVSYERYFNAETELEKQEHLKDFINSLKNHIKGLGDKFYQNLRDVNSPDYVLLFVPIESCYSLIIQNASELFNLAWQNKILLVSPATLLAALRTINIFWQQEKQTRNVIEIATQSGKLYDKFVDLLTSLEKVSKDFDKTRSSFDVVFKKLQGRGNLVSQVEKIKKLGANTQKTIPENYLEHEEDIETNNIELLTDPEIEPV